MHRLCRQCALVKFPNSLKFTDININNKRCLSYSDSDSGKNLIHKEQQQEKQINSPHGKVGCLQRNKHGLKKA